MSKTTGKDVSEEFTETRERLEQEIRDIDKQTGKLAKRKTELQELLKGPQATQ